MTPAEISELTDFAARLARVHWWRLSATMRTEAEYDDMRGDAQLGAWQAAMRFDPARNDSLLGYASTRINGAVVDGLRARWGDARHKDQPHRIDSEFLVGDLTEIVEPVCLDDAFADIDLRDSLLRAISVAGLSQQQRRVVLALLRDRPLTEVATEDGVTPEAISKRRVGALRKLAAAYAA